MGRQQEVADIIRENMDVLESVFNFGYPSVLKARCQEKAEMSGSDWVDILVEDYYEDAVQIMLDGVQ